VITGSIERSAKRQYISYSEGDFEVFCPEGATRCTFGPLLRTKFHPHRCNDKGIGPPKLKILLKFDQTAEYERSAGAYPLRDFHEICRVCTAFHNALAVEIWWICSRGYGVMAVLSSADLVFLKFLAPLAAKLCVGPPKSFWTCKNVREVLYHHAKFGGARISPAAGPPKNVFCQPVCPLCF